ncbi:ComEC/Rec2 family competence protein [Paenibacillus sp. FJAT-26967]|uniref:ComEC/Rec2 family competence protein n=1 Tax=Paenibacillus sp. FJAT-26967 TaxID=1729690 RepID=UPI000838D437|nr:ComEC/Rec2 family competence protein [Paenibacillus sp. FJAT-26967]
MVWTSKDGVWVAVLWVLGYAAAMQWQWPLLTIWAGIACAAAALAVLVLRLPQHRLIAAALIAAAACCYYADTDRRNVTALPAAAAAAVSGSEVTVAGTLVTPVAVDGDRASFQLRVSQMEGAAAETPPGERMQVNLRLLSPEEQTAAASWRRGDRLSLRGVVQEPAAARNFGGFDYRRYLRQQEIHWLLTAKGTEQVNHTPPAALYAGGGMQQLSDRLLRGSDELRSFLGGRIDMLFTAAHAGFMKSMLIGLTDDMDPDRYVQFSNLGLTHILAISGLNVAVFIGVLIWILKRLGLAKETYLLITALLLPFYILITGASPSIVRAGLMTMIGLFAVRKNREKDVLQIACLVGWALLLWNPYYLLDVSFQLSFLVTLGLIVGVPRVTLLLPVKNALLRNTLAITIVSQLASFPVSIYYFNQFSLLSWLANAVLVPVFSLVIFPAGLIAMITGLLFAPAGRTVAWVTERVNEMVFGVVQWLDQWEGFQTIWPSPSLLWMLMYFSLLALLCLSLQKYLKMRDEGSGAGPMLHIPVNNQSPGLSPSLAMVIREDSRHGTAAGALSAARPAHEGNFIRASSLKSGFFSDVSTSESEYLAGDSELKGIRHSRCFLHDKPFVVYLNRSFKNGFGIRKYAAVSAILALCWLALLFYGYTPDRWDRTAYVDMIDVGQGDSILIRSPERKFILVDGGGTVTFGKGGEEWKQRRDPFEVGKKLLVPLLKKRGVHQLDAVILTHADQDHSGGLQAVLDGIPVKQFIFNGTYKHNGQIEKLYRSAMDKNIPLLAASYGKSLQIGHDTRIDFLSPNFSPYIEQPRDTNETHVQKEPDTAGKELADSSFQDLREDSKESVLLSSEQNGYSVAFLMTILGTRWLFTGDMELDAERSVLDSLQNHTKKYVQSAPAGSSSADIGKTAPIDVLKVAHHGSKTSTSEQWLEYWNPRWAIISAGVNNRYKHPSEDVMNRLEQHGIAAYRTDLSGEIQLIIRKNEIFARTKFARDPIPVFP